jgi:hypothetical protein
MNKLTITIAVVALLSGCVSTKTARDLSTGNETALIEGVTKFLTNCSIYGPGPIEVGDYEISAGDVFGSVFGIRAPASPYRGVKSLVVDAGPVKFDVSCTSEDPFGNSVTKKASFDFVSEAGHTYTIAWQRDCMELLDATAGSVVACEPYYSGSHVDLSTTDDTAIIKAGGASRDKGNCRPTTGGRRERSDFFEVNAGSVTINGECGARILPDFLGRRRRLSRFDFVAEAGHTYTITATDKECMSLIDITSEEIVIACESYEKSK